MRKQLRYVSVCILQNFMYLISRQYLERHASVQHQKGGNGRTYIFTNVLLEAPKDSNLFGGGDWGYPLTTCISSPLILFLYVYIIMHQKPPVTVSDVVHAHVHFEISGGGGGIRRGDALDSHYM